MSWRILSLLNVGLLALGFVAASSTTNAAETKLPVPAAESLTWHDDYLDATEIARNEKKLLLVWFADPSKSDENEKFAATVLNAEGVSPLLAQMTRVKVDTTTTIESPMPAHTSLNAGIAASGASSRYITS